MVIHNKFVGGNIFVDKIDENHVYLRSEQRDTVLENGRGWFYWAFCVEGAQGEELTFHFDRKRLGTYGPAVSHDLVLWHWLEQNDDDAFTYRFKDDESKVYFAHNILYHPAHFFSFAQKNALAVEEFCKSRKGASVPCIKLGDGQISIILTARHHACESTGSYVLQGVLHELLLCPIPNTRVLCVPFVDFDGVWDGDQGKNRYPHDHNRDYIENPVYPEVASIMKYAEENGCYYAFDFHAPGHRGGENDNIFIVRNRVDRSAEYDRFAELLEEECNENSMSYRKQNDHPACTGWNQPSSNFSYTMHCRLECRLAFSLENTYFGLEENKVSAERLIELGKAFARALRKYMK